MTIVKRYARSRLYGVTQGRYVTVDELRRWFANGVPFSVLDAETGSDINHVLLA